MARAVAVTQQHQSNNSNNDNNNNNNNILNTNSINGDCYSSTGLGSINCEKEQRMRLSCLPKPYLLPSHLDASSSSPLLAALLLAVLNDDSEHLHSLILAGADPSHPIPAQFHRYTHHLKLAKHLDVIEGGTPLHFACALVKPCAVRVLLAAGASVSTLDAAGATAMQRLPWALAAASHAAVLRSKSHPIDVNISTIAGVVTAAVTTAANTVGNSSLSGSAQQQELSSAAVSLTETLTDNNDTIANVSGTTGNNVSNASAFQCIVEMLVSAGAKTDCSAVTATTTATTTTTTTATTTVSADIGSLNMLSASARDDMYLIESNDTFTCTELGAYRIPRSGTPAAKYLRNSRSVSTPTHNVSSHSTTMPKGSAWANAPGTGRNNYNSKGGMSSISNTNNSFSCDYDDYYNTDSTLDGDVLALKPTAVATASGVALPLPSVSAHWNNVAAHTVSSLLGDPIIIEAASATPPNAALLRSLLEGGADPCSRSLGLSLGVTVSGDTALHVAVKLLCHDLRHLWPETVPFGPWEVFGPLESELTQHDKHYIALITQKQEQQQQQLYLNNQANGVVRRRLDFESVVAALSQAPHVSKAKTSASAHSRVTYQPSDFYVKPPPVYATVFHDVWVKAGLPSLLSLTSKNNNTDYSNYSSCNSPYLNNTASGLNASCLRGAAATTAADAVVSQLSLLQTAARVDSAVLRIIRSRCAIISALVLAGADPLMTNERGETVYDLLQHERELIVIEYCVELNAAGYKRTVKEAVAAMGEAKLAAAVQSIVLSYIL